MPTTPVDTLLALENAQHRARAVVSAGTWATIMEIDPRLCESPYREVLIWMLTAPRTERNTLVASSYALSRAIDGPGATRDSNRNCHDIIERVGQMSGIMTRMTLPDYQAHLAREIVEMSLPQEISRAVYPVSAGELRRRGLVDVLTGRQISERIARARWEQVRAAASIHNASVDLPGDMNAWLDHMNWQAPQLYAYTDAAVQNCLDYLHRQTTRTGQLTASAHQNMVKLAETTLFPVPVYTWVRRTPRIYARGHNLTQLPSELRRLLLPRVLEVDLSCAQLTCFAKVGGANKVLEWLELRHCIGGTWWEHLGSVLGWRTLTPAQKDVLKKMTYSIIFGEKESALLKPDHGSGWGSRETPEALAVYASITADGRAALFADPLIRDLIETRNRYLAGLESNGEGRDAYERTISLESLHDGDGSKPPTARTLAAYIMATWEMRCMQPIRTATLRDGGKSRGWDVVAYQHDGVSISCRARDAGRIFDRLSGDVACYAYQMGIPAKLEIKYNGLADASADAA